MNFINKYKFCIIFIALAYYANYLYGGELTTKNIFINFYNLDQHLLNYDTFGFVKRGLIGTIFKIDKENLVLIVKIINSFLIILCSLIFNKLILHQSLDKYRSYLLLFGVSPFFFQHFGRFDYWGVLFMLLYTCLLIYKKNITFLNIISPLLLLIHEIHFFTVSIFLIWISCVVQKKFIIAGYLILANIIVLLILFRYGGISEKLINEYINQYWFIKVYFSENHLDSLFYFTGMNFKTTIPYRHFFSFLIYLFIFYYCIKNFKNKLTLSILFIFYSNIFILALDTSRFLSLFIINLLLLTLVYNSNFKLNINLPKFRKEYYLILFLGPWGVGPALPLLTVLKKFFLYGKLTFN